MVASESTGLVVPGAVQEAVTRKVVRPPAGENRPQSVVIRIRKTRWTEDRRNARRLVPEPRYLLCSFCSRGIPMTWPLIIISIGVIVTIALWATFAFIAVREIKTDMPGESFAESLNAQQAGQPAPMRVLLAIDGSAASLAAVQEMTHCQLPPGSTIELLYAIHSRLPVIPDFPPWAVTIAAAHGERIRAQMSHAPQVLAAAGNYLQGHQGNATIVTKTVEGVPKDEILREAAAWGADRIVLGSHGRGRGERVVLGSTAGAVAAEAPCTVQIVRPRKSAAQTLAEAHAA